MQAKRTDFKAHYISGTHWDREWYRPFQEYRVLLVQLVDGLLDLMERDPDFRYFHLDGCMGLLYTRAMPTGKRRVPLQF